MNLSVRIVVAVLLLALPLLTALWVLELRHEEKVAGADDPFTPSAQQVERGEYLARAGNCAACHTARGGQPYAGGRGIETPFGTVYASNLTPHEQTGIGSWSAAHFQRALREGRSRDGHLLYPAFPYPNYTQVTREDSDAIFAYLRSLPPVAQPNRAHELRFPYNTQAALAVWRILFFKPGEYVPDASHTAEWNRGAYLVGGPGHCGACHGRRNAFGATSGNPGLSGGLMPMTNWYAPSLTSADEAGVAYWKRADIIELLKTGNSPRGSAMGPMAEVVFRSTQYLSEDDLGAIATYLSALPQTAARTVAHVAELAPPLRARGEKVYRDHCAECHGRDGEGTPAAWPALAGNRAVTMTSANNPIRVVLSGGYLPATAGNPRPHGMPPFAQVLGDTDIAAALSYVRSSWGNAAAAVEPHNVTLLRQGRVN